MSVSEHVSTVISSCAQSIYALGILRGHGKIIDRVVVKQFMNHADLNGLYSQPERNFIE